MRRLTKAGAHDAGKYFVLALMLFLWLLVTAMAVCPAFHELFHKDANDRDHNYIVTAILHGQIDSLPAEVSVAAIFSGELISIGNAAYSISLSVAFLQSVRHLLFPSSRNGSPVIARRWMPLTRKI